MEGTFGDLNLKGSRSLSAIDIASENGKLNIATLLRRFKAHPEQIRREVRVKLGFPDELAAEVFALAVFLCDGSSATQASSRQISHQRRCCPSILHDYSKVTFGAADDPLPSCGRLVQRQHFVEGFRSGLQMSCQTRPFFLEVTYLPACLLSAATTSCHICLCFFFF